MLQLADEESTHDSWEDTRLKSHFDIIFILREAQLYCHKMHQSEHGVSALASLQIRVLVIFVAFKSKHVHSETLNLQKKLGAKLDQIKSIISRRFSTASFQDLLLE